MFTGHFEGDLTARVAYSDDEDAPFLKLGRIPVVGRVHLYDTRSKLRGKRGHPRDLVVPMATTTLWDSIRRSPVVTMNPSSFLVS